jgi:hypothetical protein
MAHRLQVKLPLAEIRPAAYAAGGANSSANMKFQ